jgi:23S rRNA pseudouridine1911/1915/1917 synthase
MAASLQSRVPAADAGQRLLGWLVRRFAYLDAARWRAALVEGSVQRNGGQAAPEDVLAAGDVIAFTPCADASAEPDVPVLHADDELVVVDKPAGLVVQHASAAPTRTFLARLAARFPPMGGAPRLQPIHRLDRDTSGVLLIGRTPTAIRAWSEDFAAGSVTKEYLAVVRGSPPAERFAMAAAIGPAPGSAVRSRRAALPAGAKGAQTARTDAEVIARWPGHALLRLWPRTGRTHQLRVHLADAGWPIVHDPLYGRSDDEYLQWMAGRKAADPEGHNPAAERHLLHACRVATPAADGRKGRTFCAPLPVDLANFVRSSGGPEVADLPL